MDIKLEDVAIWARLAQDLFNIHKEEVVVYDEELEDPWEEDFLIPSILAVETMISTIGYRKTSKEETAKIRTLLKGETPLLTDLDFAVNKCIKAGTITDSYNSFVISAMRQAVNAKDIVAFHTAFDVAIIKINANATELKNKGFTTSKKNLFKKNHDDAYALVASKGIIKTNMGDLSSGNKTKVKTCMELTQGMIDSTFSYAKSVGDKNLMKRATGAALLRATRPTPVKKPRTKKVNPTETIIYQRNIAENKTMQLTVKTSEALKLGRTMSIEAPLTHTMDLLPNVKVSVRKKDIPGEGKFIKISNPNFKLATVEVFIINPKKKK